MRSDDNVASTRGGGRRPYRRTRWAAASVSVALLTAAALTTAFAGVGSAATRAPASGHASPYWATVRLDGHLVRVHTAAPTGIIYQHGAHASRAASPQQANLTYHGGPVALHPKVYLDFWGSQWRSDHGGVRRYVKKFFQGLGKSDDHWSRITSQYTESGGKGPAFTGSVLKGVWIDGASAAPASASSSQLGAEAVAAAQHFNVSGTNVQVIVLSPTGTQPDGFPNAGWCAWHSEASGSGRTVPFTNEPYQLDAGQSCGENSVGGKLDGFSITAGHEYAETITDPQPGSGWTASNGEIGDLCAWQNLFKIHLTTGSFAMQPLWNNKTSGCSASA